MRASIAAAGGSTGVHLAGIVLHYHFGYEFFQYADGGWLFAWELGWGWITLFVTLLIVLSLPRYLRMAGTIRN